MKALPYALVVGSLMHMMLWIRPDVCFVIGIMSRYQFNLGMEHWTTIKHILKYLQRTRELYLGISFLLVIIPWYMNLDFKFGKDSCKCTFRLVFTLGNGVVSQRNMNQSCIVDFIMESKYITVSKATKEVTWF